MRKPAVRIESDAQSRGTPFRTCSLAIGKSSLSARDLERIRAALAPVVPNAEVTLVGSSRASLTDSTMLTRVRVNYYGEREADPERVIAAVSSAL